MKFEKATNPPEIQYPAIIFGAGEAGVAAADKLKADYSIVAFCDNDKNKVGKQLMSSPIISPEQLVNHQDCTIFIASEFAEQIMIQLESDRIVDPAKIKIVPASYVRPLTLGQDLSTRQMAESILQLIAKHLNETKVKYYVDAGTLLGIIRDGELIPWDDDLDFAIDSCHRHLVKKSLDSMLPDLESLTSCDWQLLTLKNSRDFGAVRAGEVRGYKLKPQDSTKALPLIDFFVKYVDGKWMDYTLASRGIRMPSHHITEPVMYDYKGAQVAIPNDVEAYLQRHYGDWQTPNQEWNLSDLNNATLFDGSAK